MSTRILFTIIIVILFPTVMNAQTNKTRLFNPFVMDIDPMERLLLVNIEKDPDSLYIGFEPQVFDDHINGTGQLVIAWRVDGKVDVYHQPGLRLAHEKYRIAGVYTVEKLNNEIRVSMIPSKGWKPKYSKLSLRFLYTVVKVFKKWPATYEWTATIHEKDNLYFMDSKWNRIYK